MHFVLNLGYDLRGFLGVVSRSWECVEGFTNFPIFGAVERSSAVSKYTVNKVAKYILTHLWHDRITIYSLYHRLQVPFMASSEFSKTLFFCLHVAS